MSRILVVGVSGKGRASLDAWLAARIMAADLLYGAERLLAEWPEFAGEKLAIGANVATVLKRLAARGDASTAVLATGDPGLYGIAGTLARRFPADELEVIPAVSSVQLAFARIAVPWGDAVTVSAHGRPLTETLAWARRTDKLAILTDGTNTPAAIAAVLLAQGHADCRAVVAERLDLPGECITDTRLVHLPGRSFASPNVLLLLGDAGSQTRSACVLRPDGAYVHRRGLITKRDVRALSLARLELAISDTAWDIGAGSGAMSIEMAEQAWRGHVYAIEKDAECAGFVDSNCARHGAANVTLVRGQAPEALAGLPVPDAVFIGGTGGALSEILAHVAAVTRPGCRVVLNLATLERLAQAHAILSDLGWSPTVVQVNLSYGAPIASLTRLAPANPVFVLSACLPRTGAAADGGAV